MYIQFLRYYVAECNLAHFEFDEPALPLLSHYDMLYNSYDLLHPTAYLHNCKESSNEIGLLHLDVYIVEIDRSYISLKWSAVRKLWILAGSKLTTDPSLLMI